MNENGNAVNQDMVEKILARLAQPGASTNTPPPLAINAIRMMRAKNEGFPHEMYHATLAPIMVINREQEGAMIEMGYGFSYIRQEWPQHWYRRNMSEKFEEQSRDHPGDFIESRLVRDPATLEQIQAGRIPKGCSKWFFKLDELNKEAPLPDPDTEDPQIEINRLKGQLAEAQRKADKPTKAA